MKEQSSGRLEKRSGAIAFGSGALTVAMAIAALFLPLVQSIPKAAFLGSLLSVAGLAEVALGIHRSRDEFGKAAIASGLITAVVGLIFVTSPGLGFYPVAPAVAIWLGLSGACMLIAALALKGRWIRSWLAATGMIDVLLGVLLFKGLRITSLAFILFGPTSPMVATLAAVLAASLAVRGVSQIAIGEIEHRTPSGPRPDPSRS